MPAALVTSTRRNGGAGWAESTAPTPEIRSAASRRDMRNDESFRENEALLDREEHELGGLVHAKGAHQVGPVHGDGVDAQVEHHRNFLVGLAVCDELQD